jgi:surfeit locus 1 family protein
LSKIKSLDILFLFFIFLVFSLGTWQVYRLHNKKIIIKNLEDSFKKKPIIFSLNEINNYKKIALQASPLPEKIFLYSLKEGKIGYKVIVPYAINKDNIVLVDKGWIRQDKINNINKISFTNSNNIEGYLLQIKNSYFTPANDLKEKFVYSIDLKNLENKFKKKICIYKIIEVSKSNNNIISNKYSLEIPNNHLQYIITWYGLGIALIVFFLLSRKNK